MIYGSTYGKSLDMAVLGLPNYKIERQEMVWIMVKNF